MNQNLFLEDRSLGTMDEQTVLLPSPTAQQAPLLIKNLDLMEPRMSIPLNNSFPGW